MKNEPKESFWHDWTQREHATYYDWVDEQIRIESLDLANGECPNDGDPNHDRIQNELWDERGVRNG